MPGAIPASGTPTSGSYSQPQTLHVYFIVVIISIYLSIIDVALQHLSCLVEKRRLAQRSRSSELSRGKTPDPGAGVSTPFLPCREEATRTAEQIVRAFARKDPRPGGGRFDALLDLSRRGDSNARPLRPERSALPTALLLENLVSKSPMFFPKTNIDHCAFLRKRLQSYCFFLILPNNLGEKCTSCYFLLHFSELFSPFLEQRVPHRDEPAD